MRYNSSVRLRSAHRRRSRARTTVTVSSPGPSSDADAVEPAGASSQATVTLPREAAPGAGPATPRADADDLERTDRLPLLEDVVVAPDVADDAVPLPGPPPRRTTPLPFAVEQRIARLEARVEAQAELIAALRATLAAPAASQREDDELARRVEALAEEQAELRERSTAKSEAIALLRNEFAALEAAFLRLETRLSTADAGQAGDASETGAAREAGGADDFADTGTARDLVSAHEPGAEIEAPPPPAPALDYVAELERLDGDRFVTHVLTHRTRIGRAPGCELQIDSASVSRHHALVLLGRHEVIVEDLHSTNGILVNGRRCSRQLLHDGDLVTVGEAQFRFRRHARSKVP